MIYWIISRYSCGVVIPHTCRNARADTSEKVLVLNVNKFLLRAYQSSSKFFSQHLILPKLKHYVEHIFLKTISLRLFFEVFDTCILFSMRVGFIWIFFFFGWLVSFLGFSFTRPWHFFQAPENSSNSEAREVWLLFQIYIWKTDLRRLSHKLCMN